jgi:hypothetical protein
MMSSTVALAQFDGRGNQCAMKVDDNGFAVADLRVRYPLPDHDLQRNPSASSGFNFEIGGHAPLASLMMVDR